MNINLTEKELYEKIKYFVYCLKHEINPKLCSSLNEYKEYIDNYIDSHHGDCTLDSQSCLRCQYIEIEIYAQNILDLLKEEAVNGNEAV